jgi:hypothetical protein
MAGRRGSGETMAADEDGWCARCRSPFKSMFGRRDLCTTCLARELGHTDARVRAALASFRAADNVPDGVQAVENLIDELRRRTAN